MTRELYAKYENCELLRDVLRDIDAVPLAVGAGTLNDIVASVPPANSTAPTWWCARPRPWTATPPSRSIAVDGFKQTLNCPAPAACVADWTVMAAAPQVMTASGYGDLLGKVPAGADWIIADALGAEAIDDYVWGLVQGPLRASLAEPEALATRATCPPPVNWPRAW